MKYKNVAILFLAIITIIFCCSNFKARKDKPCTELFANPPDGKDTCLYLTVDLNLPAGDSMLMSEKFLQKIRKTNPNFVIEDSTIRFENNTYRRVETFLPFNKIIHYYAQYDSVTFKLYLKRINLTDIEFLLIAEREGNVLQYARDTVVYEPYGGNEMTDKYGFRFWGYPYCTSGSKIYTQLLLAKEVKMYAAVIQNNTFDSGRDIFNRVIFLTRTDIAQPYNYFLSKSMERLIGDYENIMRQTDDDAMNHYKEDFGKFKLLVNDISLSCSDSTIYEDTTLMDRALVCSMDSVVDLLRQNGFAERKVKSQLENQLFTEYEFNHFSGTLFINWAGEVRSRDFERISFTNELYERPENPGYYIPGYIEFNNTFYSDATSMRIHLKDKIIALLADNGFENISFIITVWEKSGEDYLLKGILDKYLSSPIGFVNIRHLTTGLLNPMK